MSELTPCNYCSWKRIKRDARVGGKVVIREASKNTDAFPTLGGTNIYVKEKGEKLDRKKHFVSWFMELTNHCVC